MRPKQQQKARHDDLIPRPSRSDLNLKHELVALTHKIDWAWLDEQLAKEHGVPLRQSHTRLARRAAMMAGRYAHAKQFKLR